MLTIRPATKQDAVRMAPSMRRADVEECRAVGGLDPLASLLVGLETAQENYCLLADDDPVAIGGICRVDDVVGVPWLLASDNILKHRWPFIRLSRFVINDINRRYPLLTNVTDARNTLHVRWLQWCGFTFVRKHWRYGLEERTFYEFVRVHHE